MGAVGKTAEIIVKERNEVQHCILAHVFLRNFHALRLRKGEINYFSCIIIDLTKDILV